MYIFFRFFRHLRLDLELDKPYLIDLWQLSFKYKIIEFVIL